MLSLSKLATLLPLVVLISLPVDAQTDREIRDLVKEIRKAAPRGITAAEAYRLSLPLARKFSSDSYPVTISNLVESFLGLICKPVGDGRASLWEVDYYSPRERAAVPVFVAATGKVLAGSPGDPGDKTGKLAWKIDSDKLAQVALEAGGKNYLQRNRDLGEHYYLQLESGRPVWTMALFLGPCSQGGEGEPLFRLKVDAETGKILEMETSNP